MKENHYRRLNSRCHVLGFAFSVGIGAFCELRELQELRFFLFFFLDLLSVIQLVVACVRQKHCIRRTSTLTPEQSSRLPPPQRVWPAFSSQWHHWYCA